MTLANIIKVVLILLPFVVKWVQRRWAKQDEQEKPSSEKMGAALADGDTGRISDYLSELP